MYINFAADLLALGIRHIDAKKATKEEIRQALEEHLAAFVKENTKGVLLNICYRRSFVHSDYLDTFLYNIKRDETGNTVKDENGNVIKTEYESDVKEYDYASFTFFEVFRVFMKRDIDIFQMSIDFFRRHNIPVWFSIRMNDVHYLGEKSFDCPLSTEYPQYTIRDGAEHNSAYNMFYGDGGFDYTHKIVRDLFENYILEQLSNYDIDGIELDYLRTPPFFSDKTPDKARIMTDFVAGLKQKALKIKKDTKFAVRVFYDERKNEESGFDVINWLANGLVEVATYSNYVHPTNYEAPMAEIREKVEKLNTGKHSYELLCGCDFGVNCTTDNLSSLTPELMQGFYNTSVARGADDIYIFNAVIDREFTSIMDETTGTLVRGLDKMLDSTMPDGKLSRYVHIGVEQEKRYPINLMPGEEYAVSFMTDLPKGTARVIVGTSDCADFAVSYKGEFYGASLITCPFSSYTKRLDKDWLKTVYEVAPFVAATQPIQIDGGKASFVLKNTGDGEMSVRWIELEKTL